jgi:hypothetical protein
MLVLWISSVLYCPARDISSACDDRMETTGNMHIVRARGGEREC